MMTIVCDGCNQEARHPHYELRNISEIYAPGDVEPDRELHFHDLACLEAWAQEERLSRGTS